MNITTGSLRDAEYVGMYWSAVAYFYDGYANELWINDNTVRLSPNSARWYGFTVRCGTRAISNRDKMKLNL